MYEEEKKVKRELDKIEKKLNKLKGEYDLIMKKIAQNPAKPDLDLLKELAEVEKQIKQAEEDWIITGENI